MSAKLLKTLRLRLPMFSAQAPREATMPHRYGPHIWQTFPSLDYATSASPGRPMPSRSTATSTPPKEPEMAEAQEPREGDVHVSGTIERSE